MNKRLKHLLYGASLALSLGLSASVINPQNASAANTSNGAVVKKVVDISEWQGNVSYQKALALKSETSFVIVRVQYGSNYKDVQYQNTIANLEKAGTPYGVYSYSRYVNASDAKQEARDLYNRAKHAKFFVNDAEEYTTTSGYYASAVKSWGAEMQRLTSRPVILYSGSYFYNSYIRSMANYDAFWEANYSNHYLSGNTSLWQYTDSGYSTSLGRGVDTSKVITSKHPVKWWIGSGSASQQNVKKYYVGGFKVGDKVKIKSSGAKWNVGNSKVPVASSALKKTYTVGQIKQVTQGKSHQMLLLKNGKTVIGWTLAEYVAKQNVSSHAKPANSHKVTSQTYNQNGTFYPNTTLNVRTGAGTNYAKVATYYKGESVKYNQVIIKSDYVWARYLRSNGRYGYIALGVNGGQSYGKRVVSTSHTYYTVKSGDSLWKIANDHGTTISNLTSLNGISMYSTIYPNQRLIIS